MKLFMAVTALLLQVNAGASPSGGGMQTMDACSFAKSVDMSADSSLCAKEGVDARGYNGGARVMLVGEEKRCGENGCLSTRKSVPRPPLFTDQEKAQAKAALPRLAGVGGIVVGTFFVLLGADLATTAVIPAVVALVGVALIIDGVTVAATGKSMGRRVYESYVR